MTENRAVGSRRRRGFTLMEIMIVVAIIAILAAIAFPSYMQSARKSRRVDAKAALLDLAQREERYMSTSNVYTSDPVALGYAAGSSFPMGVASGNTVYYNLAVTVPSSDGQTFTATATPVSSQTADTCGAYQLASTGGQSISGGTASAADCW